MGFFGNMMNNYMYGKAGQKDYTVSDMPKNRFELFGTVLKTRWGSMCGVNLLYLVFWLPAIIWSYIALLPLLQTLMEGTGDALTRYSYLFYWVLGLIPCSVIGGLFTPGATKVIRNWARDEHSFVWSDFWEAVRQNWRQSLPVSFLNGLFNFLTLVGFHFYRTQMQSSVVWMFPLALLMMFYMVWRLAQMVIYMMMVTYELNLRSLIRNALLITLGSLPKAIGIKLLTYVVPLLALALMLIAPNLQVYVIMVLVLLYAAFLVSFNLLIKMSYANAVCEKYLNAQIEGAQTNIGLRPEDWDDTVYRPEDDEE